MNLLYPVFKRQLASYLLAPMTYLGSTAFLILSITLGLHTSQLLERGSSDLQGFFSWHPWLYLILVPALSSQLWLDESQSGFGELMKTLPITPAELVIGKFLAVWAVAAMVLLLSSPIVVAVNLLGTADNGLIASQFLSSWLLVGSYLSVGCLICALTRQRLVIFMLTLSLLLMASGLSSVLDALEHQEPLWIFDKLRSLSPSLRFELIDNGLLTLRESAYFISMMVAFLAATIVIINFKNS
ncbi:ABC transporter permease [Pseudomonas sp. S35]|uniref:ABC transporter permease n=1 Tax=Pseudomonas sp. S35 TaxID=1573719 RepID=UPI00132EFED8|nr:ABC transporter permease [Pseudomonas sp. S35]QHF43893.1 ABC transporter permease [Pseudomonas sp. S35]